MQAGFSQCMQDTRKYSMTSSAGCSSLSKWFHFTPGATWFSSLQATKQAWQPTQSSALTMIPYLLMTISLGFLFNTDGIFEVARIAGQRVAIAAVHEFLGILVVEPAILSVNRADRNYQRDHCFSFYRTAIRGSDEDRIAFLNTSGFRVFRLMLTCRQSSISIR